MTSLSCDPVDIKVSVAMITFNHERFIAQALESILMQETRFRVEIVIGEDCSTDGTRAIVSAFAQKYPERIRALLPAHNLGMIPNLATTLGNCCGQYIAICEGDDYWTDPHKLQKQVEFMEAHPECAFCLHDVELVYENGVRPSYRHRNPEGKSVYGLDDILHRPLSQTASLLYRNHMVEQFPDWFYSAPIGDWALNVLLAEHGLIGYIDECMSVWRIHTGGAWNGIAESDQLRQRLRMYDLFDAHLGYRYSEVLERGRAECHYGLALDCWLNDLEAEQARWMSFVTERFSKVAEPLFTPVLYSTLAIQTKYGYPKAQRALVWTCEVIRGLPGGAEWCRKLCGEWYAGAAYQAFNANERQLAFSLSCRAVSNDWRNLGNLGFVKRWAKAMIGGWRQMRSARIAGAAQHSSTIHDVDRVNRCEIKE